MQLLKTYLIFLALLITAGSISGQPLSAFEFSSEFNKAEKLLEDGDFQEALLLYKKLLKDQPDNANVNFKTGFCYLNTVLEKKEAISYLEKAILTRSTSCIGLETGKRLDIMLG